MKKLFLAMTMAVLCTLAVTAQKKRVATTGGGNKFAVLRMNELKDLNQGPTKVFFVAMYDGNKVYALDKKTGAVTVMLGENNDDSRPEVTSVCETADGRILVATDDATYEWSGSSLATSKLLLNSGGLLRLSPNGKYLAVGSQVYNAKNMSRISYCDETLGTYNEGLCVDDFGNVWGVYGGGLRYVRPGSNEPRGAEGQWFSDFSVGNVQYNPLDSMVYATAGPNVIATPAQNPGAWRQVAQGDKNFRGQFARFAISPKGDFVMAKRNEYEAPFLTTFSGGLDKQPTTSARIATGIPIATSYKQEQRYELAGDAHKLMFDEQGNLIVHLSSNHSYYTTIIYNPGGIKGYAALVGKAYDNTK